MTDKIAKNAQNDWEQNLISFCRRLIQTPSIHGSEKEVAEVIKEEMERLDFDRVWIDRWGNVIGMIKGNASEEDKKNPLLLDCHIDTVGITDEEKWSFPPFSGELVDGKIYGRGAADMKGALAAAVYALAYFKKENRIKHDVYISGTICEEIQEGATFKKVIDEVNPALVIICEASNLNLKTGQRGRAEVVIETAGKSAHSSNPEIGVNAVKKMFKIMEKLEKVELPEHDYLAPAIMEITDIHSEPYPGMSVIPDYCKVTLDRRLMVGETMEEVVGSLQAIIDNLAETDPELKGKVSIAKADFTTYTGEKIEAFKFAPGWYFSAEEDFIRRALEGLKKAGLDPEITTYNFCTNGSMSAGFLNIPTIGFGPCSEDRAHIVDEYITVSELIKAFEGYKGIVENF